MNYHRVITEKITNFPTFIHRYLWKCTRNFQQKCSFSIQHLKITVTCTLSHHSDNITDEDLKKILKCACTLRGNDGNSEKKIVGIQDSRDEKKNDK